MRITDTMGRRGTSMVGAAVAAAALAGAGIAWAQAPAAAPVHFDPQFTAGQTVRYEIAFEETIEQTLQGAAPTTTTRSQAATIALTFSEVARDGSALVTAKVEKAAMSMKSGDTTLAYTVPPAAAEAGAEGVADLGRLLAAAEITFAVTADGKVEDLAGLTEFVEAAQSAAPFTEIAGVFSPGVLTKTLEPLFTVDGAALERRSPQATWETTEEVNLGRTGVMDIITAFTFAGVQDGTAQVAGTPTVRVRRPTQPAPEVANVSVEETSGYTRIEYDTQNHHVKAREQVFRQKSVWTLGQEGAEGFVRIDQAQSSKKSVKRAG